MQIYNKLKSKKVSAVANSKDKISEPKRRSSLLITKVSNQSFFALILVEIFVVSLLAYFFVIKNIQKELASIKYDLLPTRQQEFTELNQRYVNFTQINKSFGELKPDTIQKSKIALPMQANLPDTLVMLENIVESSGFIIDSLSISIVDEKGKAILASQNLVSRNITRAEKLNSDLLTKLIEQEIERVKSYSFGDLRIVSVDMDISQGGYSGFKSLMRKLESSLRLVDVDSFKFSTKDKKLNIKLSSYYLIETTEL
ncbi:MAG: hypothetical protein ABIF17_05255 [Patescibacteria group bacterium]